MHAVTTNILKLGIVVEDQCSFWHSLRRRAGAAHGGSSSRSQPQVADADVRCRLAPEHQVEAVTPEMLKLQVLGKAVTPEMVEEAAGVRWGLPHLSIRWKLFSYLHIKYLGICMASLGGCSSGWMRRRQLLPAGGGCGWRGAGGGVRAADCSCYIQVKLQAPG